MRNETKEKEQSEENETRSINVLLLFLRSLCSFHVLLSFSTSQFYTLLARGTLLDYSLNKLNKTTEYPRSTRARPPSFYEQLNLGYEKSHEESRVSLVTHADHVHRRSVRSEQSQSRSFDRSDLGHQEWRTASIGRVFHSTSDGLVVTAIGSAEELRVGE